MLVCVCVGMFLTFCLISFVMSAEERQIPDHVPEQLNHLRTLVDSLLAEKEKV